MDNSAERIMLGFGLLIVGLVLGLGLWTTTVLTTSSDRKANQLEEQRQIALNYQISMKEILNKCYTEGYTFYLDGEEIKASEDKVSTYITKYVIDVNDEDKTVNMTIPVQRESRRSTNYFPIPIFMNQAERGELFPRSNYIRR